MNALRKITDWLRKPWPEGDRETLVEAQRLQHDRETIRGSQGTTGVGAGLANSGVTPTPDVLRPEQER
jgi:hypothetical protein